MEGLEFFTSEQLIAELMKRSTFAGIIVYSQEPQKEQDQEHSAFNLLTKAEPEDTITILKKAITAIKQGIQG